MAWFRRSEPPPARQTAPAVEPSDPHADLPADDRPDALREAVRGVVRLVNASAGDLPVEAVVAARRTTDLLVQVVDTSEVRPLDVYAAISVRAMATDYLPTTVRTYLAVGPDLVDVPASGTTPRQALLAQLADLEQGAADVLDAARRQDVAALMTQGRFLQTKFTGSDLDL